MAGLLILALIGGYIYLAWWAIQKPHALWIKALLLLGFVLLPTADAVYGRIKLKLLCEKEGGLRIYRTVENVEGFLINQSPEKEWIVNNGYRFVEGKNYRGKIIRISRDEKGIIVTQENVLPQSLYEYFHEDAHITPTIKRFSSKVIDRNSNEILSEFAGFGFAGGWVERHLFRPLADSEGRGGGICDGIEVLPTKQITQTLKSINNH